MTEKEVIEAYYDRLRREQKANGTYDASRAFQNGIGAPIIGEINTKNVIKSTSSGGWIDYFAKRYETYFDNGRR